MLKSLYIAPFGGNNLLSTTAAGGINLNDGPVFELPIMENASLHPEIETLRSFTPLSHLSREQL
ncbi:MAG: hypothetical protein ABW153_19795, partial [Sedimenticola sp.]